MSGLSASVEKYNIKKTSSISSPGGATMQVEVAQTPVQTVPIRTESQALTPEGKSFLSNFLKQAVKITVEGVHYLMNSARLDNNYFSSLKTPEQRIIAKLLREAAKAAEEEKKKNLEEMEMAKQAIDRMQINPDIKREMIAELNSARISPDGRPTSLAGVALVRNASQGEEKTLREFEQAKTQQTEGPIVQESREVKGS